jgi:hypothetical protein
VNVSQLRLRSEKFDDDNDDDNNNNNKRERKVEERILEEIEISFGYRIKCKE